MVMMRTVSRVLVALLISVATALGMVVLQPTAALAGETDNIYSLINEARWSQGSTGLVRNSAMDAVAADWAAALANSGALAHNPNYSNQIPGGWISAGENVAQGYGGGSAMHEGWMNSPGHRANILGDFTDVGIAYLEAGGTTWGVEVFANYPGSVGPAAPAPAAPAPAAVEPVVEAPAAAVVPVPVASPVPSSAPKPDAATGRDVDRERADWAATPSRSGLESSSANNSAAANQSSAIAPVSAGSPVWIVALGIVVIVAAVLRISLRRTRTTARSR